MKIASFVCILALFGCAADPPEQQSSALGLTTPYALANFPGGFEMESVTGDERVIFAGVVTASPDQAVGVIAASRLSRQPIGSVTPPPGGFQVVTSVLVTDSETCATGTRGTLIVGDTGGVPPNAHVVLYRYSYSYSGGQLTTTLLDSHTLPQQTFPPMTVDGVGFTASIVKLPGGGVAIADAFNGAIWTCGPTLADCHLSFADQALGPAPAPPSFTGVGRAPGGGTRSYTLTIVNGLMPGLLDIDYADSTDEVCGLVAAPPGGLYCVARSVLLDTTTSPFAKAKRTLVAPQVGLSDGGHGAAFDHWNPQNPWFYWVRALADNAGGNTNKIWRVHLQTGEVQEVAESLTVMDFSTGLSTIPPLLRDSPLTHLAVAMGQEEFNPLLNPALNGAFQFVSPTIIAGAIVSSN